MERSWSTHACHVNMAEGMGRGHAREDACLIEYHVSMV